MNPRRGSAGVFTTDRALVVRSWDAWLADATGVSELEATGRTLAELFPEIESRGLLPRLRRAVEAGAVEVLAPAFHEYLIPCPPGAPSAHFARMQQLVTVAPLPGGAGDIVGVAVTIEDVTERRDHERDLALQLESADDAVRLRAARTLAAAGGGGSVALPLAGVLGDPSWRVRRAAAEGLARASDDDAALDALLHAVRERHRDPAVLNAALAALVHAGRDVVAPLTALLSARDADRDLADEDADVRTYAALALGLLEDRRAVPALVAALGDDDANVRFHAIEALGRIGSREAALPVAAVAETRDFSVAFAALDTLALIGEPSVAPRLVPLLDDDLLQIAAAEALGRLGSEDAVAPLAALLERGTESAVAAAGALAAIAQRLDGPAVSDGRGGAGSGGGAADIAALVRGVASPAAVRNLIDALATATDAECAGPVAVLGWLDGDGVERALADALRRPAVRRAAAEALARRGPAAVEPVVDALASDDVEVRKAAAATLGRLGAAQAMPALVALLDHEPDLAVVAAGALGSVGDGRAFEALLARLDHPQAAVRQAAVAALNSIGHPETSEQLRAALAHDSPRVREGAARIAGYVGDARVVEPTLALCHDPDESVRRAAVEQLPHLDDPRALVLLVEALDAGTSGVRAAAARALAHVGAAEALPRLHAACADADPWVRYYAARSLGHHRRGDAVATLVRLATADAVPPVRIAAVEALAEIGSPDGLAALVPLADDPDPAIARQALLALGRARDEATLSALLAALPSDDRGRQVAALDALSRRADASGSAPAVVAAVAPLARDGGGGGDPEVRARAVGVLAGVGGEEAVAALVGVLADPRRTSDVVAALAGLGEKEVPWVGRGLAHADAAVRCAVVEALGRMPHAAATAAPLLAGALHDGDEAVRVAAAHALGRLDLRATRATRAAGGGGDAGQRHASGG